jgi:hypothetical protein
MEDEDLPAVLVKPAFVWDCLCGHRNFDVPVVVELDAETIEELRDDGVEEARLKTGEWTSCPDILECQKCGQQFSPFDPRSG